ncbi:MAG: flagellar basal body P-ring formation chaperone FlgA [Myxococcota bacterium]
MIPALRLRFRRAALGLALTLAALLAPATGSGEAADPLAEMIDAYVRNRAAGPVTAVEVPALPQFALGDDDDFDVSISSRPEQPMSGWVPLTVTVARNGEEVRTGVVTVRVKAPRSIVVARHRLARGAVVRAEDLVTEQHSEGRLASDVLQDPQFAVGMRLRRSVPAKHALRERDVEIAPVVQRGQPVKLVLESGRLRLDTTGRALEDGRPGEWIRVRSAASRQVIEGRVGRNGIVYVES